jgi:hypothetical protein
MDAMAPLIAQHAISKVPEVTSAGSDHRVLGDQGADHGHR